MALIKSKEEYGVPVNYWRIEEVSLNRKNKSGYIGVRLFANKEAERFIDAYTFPIKPENFDEFFEVEGEFSDLYNCCYEYIKATYPEEEMIDDEDQVVKAAK